MAMRLIDPTKPVAWVHPSERGPDGKPLPDCTVWYINVLTHGAMQALRAKAAADPESNPFSDGSVLRQCIVKIDNAILPGETEARTLTDPGDIDKFIAGLVATDSARAVLGCTEISALDEGAIKN